MIPLWLSKLPYKAIGVALLMVGIWYGGWHLRGTVELAKQAKAHEAAVVALQDAVKKQHGIDLAQLTADALRARTAAEERNRLQFERDALLANVATLKARGQLTVTKVMHDATGDHTCPDLSTDWLRGYNAIATGPIRAPATPRSRDDYLPAGQLSAP